MRLPRCLLPAFIFLSFLSAAQQGDKARHDSCAERIRLLYNEKKFAEIYASLGDELKWAMPETEFTGFLNQKLYNTFGDMSRLEYLGEEKNFYAYLAYFEQGTLQMNITVTGDKQVTGLQFLPYSPPFKSKITDYLSDNKKQSPLDLLVDSVVRSFMQSPQNCGLSIGISKNGSAYFYNYGEIKKGSKILPGQNTIYETGSLTKTFCGLLLAQAVIEKKIKLNDDIRHYLPGKYPNLAFNEKPVLVKHLASHSSGLERIPGDLTLLPGFDSLNPYKNYTREMVFNYLRTVKLSREPGTTCEYSNLGMALLGIILERIYDKTFEALVKEKICLPLGMNSTAVNLNEEQATRLAEGYNQEGLPTPHWELNGFAAAGALRSSAGDLLRYLDYNLREPDEACRLAHQVAYSGRENVALAWFISKTSFNNALVWHNGATYGSSCFSGFIKTKGCAVIILSNTVTPVDPIGIALLKYLQQ